MFATYVGILLALGVVTGLLWGLARVLRRVLPSGTGQGRLPLTVLQRAAVGPRQGIALVQVGNRVVVVSVGDGGVHRLFELDEDEAAAMLASAEPTAADGATPRPDFRGVLGAALRRSGIAMTALVLAASLGGAQAAPVAAPTLTPPPPPAVAAPDAARPQVAPAARPPGTAAAPSTPPAAPAAAAPQAGQALATTEALVTRLAPRMDLRVGSDGAAAGDGLRLTGTVGVVVTLGLLTFLPALVLMTTSFTRILVVLQFLKQAMGSQGAPPAQLVTGFALILTGFVMGPTLNQMNRAAITPWLDGQIEQGAMIERAAEPLRAFMLRQTRETDIARFVRMSRAAPPATPQDVPFTTLMAAFVTSELRTAFAIGFALFLPFIVIDIVTSSVLMSLGMFMLPPAMVALPFKLLLFVLVDGWGLVTQSLVAGFR